MPDWDGNGKNDWHDDFVFNEIINRKSDSSDNNRCSSFSFGRLPWWFWVLAVLILLFWKQ